MSDFIARYAAARKAAIARDFAKLNPEQRRGVLTTEGALLLLAGAGSALFILAGVPRAAAERLLQIGEYTREAKRKGALLEVFSSVYWLAATAVYLLLSFRNGWDRSWMLWPVAGVIFAALYALLEALTGRRK